MRLLGCFALVLLGCEGPAGPQGPAGDPGLDGAPGATGDAGPKGDPGDPPDPSPWLAAPGIDLTITGLDVAAAGASVQFTLTNGAGVVVDPSGRLTDGIVEIGVVLSQLAHDANGEPALYTPYAVTGALRTIDVVAGAYAYDFGGALPMLELDQVQTVGVYAIRGESIDRDTRSMRPDAGVVVDRQVVTEAKCNSCHGTLNAHDGKWTKPSQCVLCHQDLNVLTHQIHRDTFPHEVSNCTSCHAGTQGDRWKTEPTKTTCTSCHATVSFEQPVPVGMTLHGGGPQPDDITCGVCHPASGGLAGISDKHLVGLLAPNAPSVELSIISITNTAPAQAPVLRFRALGAPTTITATIAGPNTDYATFWQAKIMGTGAVGTLVTVDATAGIYDYTFPTPIPAGATGSYTVGLEGYLQSGATRFASANPVRAFAVTDAVAQPRRAIVEAERCNSCHRDLSAHGGARKTPEYCVMCHNPKKANDTRAPAVEGSSLLVESVDFRVMVHKIHQGEQLTQPYVLYGFGGSTLDFSAVKFPRPTTDCEGCHASRNWTLPMTSSPAYAPSTRVTMTCSEDPSADTNTVCEAPFWTATSSTTIAPETSVCTSCHDAPYVVAHAQLETTLGGIEACATCHGPGAVYDVSKFHGTR